MNVTVLKKKESKKKEPVVTTRTNERQVLAKIQMTRAKNLLLLAQAAGSVTELADLVEANPQNIQNYIETKLAISDEFAAHIEFSLDLPARWLDHTHEEKNMEAELRKIIENAKKLKEVTEANDFGDEEAIDSIEQPERSQMNGTEKTIELVEKTESEKLDTDLPLDDLVDHYRSIALRKLDETEREQFVELGKVLSALLSDKGIKQRLAQALEVHPSAVSLMLKGSRPITPEHALDIAEFLSSECGDEAREHFVKAYKKLILPIYEERRKKIGKAFENHMIKASSSDAPGGMTSASSFPGKGNLAELSKAFAEAFATSFAKFLDDYVAKKK